LGVVVAHCEKLSEGLGGLSAKFLANPCDTSGSTGRRLAFVDTARGLLFLLMASSHAVTLAGIPSDSFWRSAWWLPRGWATQGFIVLSGFTVGLLFRWQGDGTRVQGRLFRHSRQILSVMFVSNVVMLLLTHALSGDLGITAAWDWWWGLITFKTPYSISAILLPTSLLLACAPWILRFEEQRWYLLFPLALGFSVAVAGAEMSVVAMQRVPRWLDLLLVSGIGGFRPLPLFAGGVVGLACGRLCLRHPALVAPLLFAGCTTWLVGTGDGEVIGVEVHRLYRYSLSGSSQLLVILTVSCIATGIVPQLFPWRPLADIGQYALFSFVAHRIVMQGVHFVIEWLQFTSSDSTIYLVLLSVTMALVWGGCATRQRHEGLDRALRAVFL